MVRPGNGACSGYEAYLSYSFDTEGRPRLRNLNEDHLDLWHVLGPDDVELAEC